MRALTRGPKHHFFGFHDLCPWDQSGRFILALETDFIDRPPKLEDKARICLIDLESDNKVEVLSETSAWNFHQGCRAQWLPNDSDKIIYNDRRNDRFVSVVFDVKNRKEIKIFDYPVYAVSPKGSFGLGLDFASLYKHGGYGYIASLDYSDENQGIVRIDFVSGKTEMVIPGKLLTHVVFNPSGTRICYSQKNKLPDGGFWNKFFTADPDGGNTYELPGHISHFDWKNDEEIIGFGKSSTKIMELRKSGFFNFPLLRPLLYVVRKMRGSLKQKIASQGYFMFQDYSKNLKSVGRGVLTEDGHPQFSPDGKWIVTDTYPDKNHKRTLMLYNLETNRKFDIGKFNSLPKGFSESWDLSEMRADLHPRFNHDGTQICIDSVDQNSRQMYVLSVDDIVTNN